MAVLMVVFVTGCGACIGNGDVDGPDREGRWGIYYLDLDTGDTELIISFDDPIGTIRLDPSGQWLAFSKNIDDGERSMRRYARSQSRERTSESLLRTGIGTCIPHGRAMGRG